MIKFKKVMALTVATGVAVSSLCGVAFADEDVIIPEETGIIEIENELAEEAVVTNDGADLAEEALASIDEADNEEILSMSAFKMVENPFEDTVGEWFENSVNFLYALGLVKGKEENLFCPNDNVTEGEVLIIAGRVVSIIMKNGEFDETQFYGEAYENKSTRTYLASVLYDAYKAKYGIELGEVDLSKFVDVADVAEDKTDVYKWVVSKGIMLGDDLNMLNPNADVTRAEAAAMFERFIGIVIDAEIGAEIGQSEQTETDKEVGIANPMVEYDNLMDAKVASGLSLPTFNKLNFTTDKVFVINGEDKENAVLELDGIFNGKEISIRAGKGDKDISGIYNAEDVTDYTSNYNVSFKKYEDTVIAVWGVKQKDGSVLSYSVALKGGSAEEAEKFVKEIGAELAALSK